MKHFQLTPFLAETIAMSGNKCWL